MHKKNDKIKFSTSTHIYAILTPVHEYTAVLLSKF